MTTQQKTEIAKRACTIIFANEGNYGSVNANDNGALSIGKVQWHGNLAFIAQCLLYINGYDSKGLDSKFGSNSTKAATLFQSEHNLVANGSVGRLTFAKLVA